MTRRVRVLFYIGSMDAGGAERQIVEFIKRLDRSRFEPVLGLAAKEGPLLCEIPEDVPIFEFQPHPPTLRKFGLGRFQRWSALAKFLRQRRIDVIYDRTFLATLDTGPATWWCRTPRISMIVADPRIQMDLYFPRRQALWRRFARTVYRTASFVLTNSQGLQSQVIEYFQLPPEHVRVLPNVLNLARMDELSQEPLATDADSRFRILTVGRIDQHKGHRDLLEAIRRLTKEHGRSDILWQILGDGPDRPALLGEAERLGLAEQIEWLGIVANPYMYYRAADLFCLPSLSEGSPNVLIEALALGTPVLSTDCPSGPREILADGQWGTLVPTHDPAALAAAISDRMASPAAWLERARQAQPIIREKHDVTTGIRRLEALLIEVAGQQQRV